MGVELETINFQKKFWEGDKKKELAALRRDLLSKSINMDHVSMIFEDFCGQLMRNEDVIFMLRE